MHRAPIRSIGRNKRRRGSSMIEFALGFLIFLLVMAGLLELGRGVWTFTTIAHAARQGARYAQSRGSNYGASQTQVSSEVQDRVRNAAVGLNRNEVQVTTTWPSGITKGRFVVVEVQYPFQTVSGSLILQQGTVGIRASSRVPITN